MNEVYIYIGQSVLYLSNLIMYNFYVQISYMDTESLLMKIKI